MSSHEVDRNQITDLTAHLEKRLEVFGEVSPVPDAMMPDYKVLETNPTFKDRFAAIVQTHLEELQAADQFLADDPKGVEGKFWRSIQAADRAQQAVKALCTELGISGEQYWMHEEALAMLHFCGQEGAADG